MHPNPNALELTCYGNGYAWLRPTEPAEEDETLYTLTDLGRRALATARWLDRGLTVAQVFERQPAARSATIRGVA